VKQVLQDPRSGRLHLANVGRPALEGDRLLVRNEFSALSIGTERQMLDFGRKSLLGKARSRPDLAAKVLATARTEGVGEAFRQAIGRLNTYVPLGYSSAGVVVDTGAAVEGFKVGDRVACSGSSFACHAEFVSVPSSLCVRLPNHVASDEASLTALGAIALHALRVARLQPDERVVIIGLGLLGLLAVQIAVSWRCHVAAVDVDDDRVEKATSFGATALNSNRTDVARSLEHFSGRPGVDVVAIFAAAKSNQPLELASAIAADGGRIVAPGLIGLTVPRRLFFEKELQLTIPRAWGAGSDGRPKETSTYRRSGPSAQENLRQFLELVAAGDVRLKPLITHRLSIDDALRAYEMLDSTIPRPLGMLLSYPTDADSSLVIANGSEHNEERTGRARIGIGLIGAGGFARSTILPILSKMPDVGLRGVATASGATGKSVADRFGFHYSTTDAASILADPSIEGVVIATRHHLHADQVVAALKAGKHVFVEKPLALTIDELRRVIDAANAAPGLLMVGFNRRYAPRTIAVRNWLAAAHGPTQLMCRINSAPVPPDHWIRSQKEGGGRILGEACHFVDLLQVISGSRIIEVTGRPTGAVLPRDTNTENFAAVLAFEDGSVATLTYTTLGTRTLPRERIEAFRGGTACVIDNFRTATCWRNGRQLNERGWSADRGHRSQFTTFVNAMRHKGQPASADVRDYAYSTLATICLDHAVRTGETVDIRERWSQMFTATIA
jgi:2-desacetyl-2-hydroxyethyl bacteriochlorophyllide A dehydrogenase